MYFGQTLFTRQAGSRRKGAIGHVIAQQQVDPARLSTLWQSCPDLRVQCHPQASPLRRIRTQTYQWLSEKQVIRHIERQKIDLFRYSNLY
jgi:hypothetical protein